VTDRDTERAAEIVAGMGDAGPLRSVAAIVVGFIVLTFGSVIASRILLGVTGPASGASPSNAFLAWSIGSRLLAAVAAGYLTARAAPKAPFLHAGILAAVITFMALAALGGLTAAGAIEDPAWYPTAMVFVGPAGVLAGGWLRAGRSK